MWSKQPAWISRGFTRFSKLKTIAVPTKQEATEMKVGARNQLTGKVTSIKRGEVMAQLKFVIPAESTMGSVITVESLDDLNLQVGDEITLFVKAVNVLPVKME
jgi:molybdate transport system regulatory protein